MKTPTKRMAHRLAAVLAIATAFATTSAWAWDSYYWTGATSADYNTAANWTTNHVDAASEAPAWRSGKDLYFETADIVSYRVEFGKNSYNRGGWYINTGTEAQPLEFYCTKGSTIVSPDSSQYNYASGLTVASGFDCWVWINGGQWDEFAGAVTIGSSGYAGHFLIGNARGVDTLFKTTGNFLFNQGSIAVSNATVNIGGQLIVGNTAGKLTSFDFYNSTMVISNYFNVQNSARFDLCGGSITNVAKYLTVDDSGEMTIRDGGRYSCQDTLIVGNNGAGTLNIIDGGEAASGRRLSLGYTSGSSGTVNIASGGILTVPYIHLYHNEGSATVALDGGTIRAAQDGQTLIQAKANLHVTVGANGGTIDASGYNVTIAEDLDNAAGATGAMTFKGGGTVTLSGAINYTGGTTVEVGTTLIVKSAIAGDKLAFTIPDGLADGVYEVVRISGSNEKFAENVLDNVTQSPTARFVLNSARTGIYLHNGNVEGDGKVWTGMAGDGKLSSAENWLDGTQPAAGDVLNFSAANAILALNADLGEITPSTLMFGTKVVTISEGTLNVSALTNANKLAVASGATLNVAGDLVVCDASGAFLHSNEGTVKVAGNAVCTTPTSVTTTRQYADVTATTQPIQAGGLRYDRGGGRVFWRMESNADGAGAWVVGANGFTFNNPENRNSTRFYAQDNPVTLYSSANWTLANTGLNNTSNGDLEVYSSSSLTIDTTDYNDGTTPRTVTLEGRVKADGNVTIAGCGTVIVATTANPSGLTDTTVASGKTVAVTDTATLQVNAGKAIKGAGTISLAAGTTLAFESTSSTFATPDIVPVALPETGAVTINIDGTKLRGRVDHTICTLTELPDGYNVSDHVTVTGTALDGRKYEVKTVEVTENEPTVTNLVLDIQPTGLMVIFR